MAHKTVEFEQLVQKLMDEWKVPGLSMAVVQGDEIDAKSYGLANLSGEICTEDTIFDLASTSKTTTAAAVGCLVDSEKHPDVQWTTPVSKLLPDDFVLADAESTRNVTIEDILSHRSGMPGHDASYLSVRAAHPDNAKSMTRNLRNLPLNKPLRSTWQYSNIMYTVATHLVETVSGETYADFLRTRLWKPLGMSDTYHDLPGLADAAAKQRLATGYRWDKKREEYVSIPVFAQPEGQGAGSVFSTAADSAKWIRALLGRTAPLSETVQKDLVTPRSIVPVEEGREIPFYSPSLYALGLMVETYRGRKVVGHDGSVSGFKALMRYMPEFDWGVVMFGNAEGAFYVEQILYHVLMDDVLKVRGEERVDWEKFWKEWEEKDEAEAEEEDEDLNLQALEHPEPLGVPLDALAGEYYNDGYKGLVLEMKNGSLVADCDDRCFPFVLTFSHLSGKTFVVEMEDVWDAETTKMKAKIRIGDGGKVEALGVEFEEEMKGYLVWFDRVE